MDSKSPSEDSLFNDGMRDSNLRHNRGSETPPDNAGDGNTGDGRDNTAPGRPKRIACVICRKRKLRCDGEKPSCGTCSRLNHRCAYDEMRKKSGPKRGYVKELEARLKQVEGILESNKKTSRAQPRAAPRTSRADVQLEDTNSGEGMGGFDMMSGFASLAGAAEMTSGQGVPNVTVTSEVAADTGNDFPWEMIGLGLDEPLPPQDMIDELHQLYFDKIASSLPMIHKYRYLAAMNLAPHMRPAICLRYAMWAMACSVTDKYMNYGEVFYQRARKYAEADEMKGNGESFITVGHAQCWVLICMFEFKMLFFPRAWMSAGRGARLALMLGLHRQDGTGLDVKQCLPPARDWTDKEERRRTFWLAYCNDRYASVGTGWPMSIEESDIMTKLPSSNENYEKSQEVKTSSLPEAMTGDGAASISSLGGVVIMACLFGKNLTHLHRSTDSDRPGDPSGEFWKRHHKLDAILMTTSMYLPDHLRMPSQSKDANVPYLNMVIHSATICLHQAAILKAEKHNLSSKVVRESTERCHVAAGEIVGLSRLISQLDLATMNPFISFCLYVAARIFLHAYKKHPNDESVQGNLNFLLITMQAHRKKNNLTESFLVQLEVELDSAGLAHPLHNNFNATNSTSQRYVPEEGRSCPPLFPPLGKEQLSFIEVQQQHRLSLNKSLMEYYVSSNNSGNNSQIPSPQPHIQSRFAVQVPTREIPPYANSNQTQAGAGTNWPDQNASNNNVYLNPGYSPADADISSEEVVLTPGQSDPQTSSHASYSPASQAPGLEQACFNQQNQFVRRGEFPTPGQAANDVGGYEVPSGWDMQGGMVDQSAIPEASWDPLFGGATWDPTQQADMTNWRPMAAGAANGI